MSYILKEYLKLFSNAPRINDKGLHFDWVNNIRETKAKEDKDKIKKLKDLVSIITPSIRIVYIDRFIT